MKIFKSTSSDQIIQMADKKAMQSWDPELPLLFIGYIQDKLLETYDTSVRKEVEVYLGEILEEIAVPKLITALNHEDVEVRRKISAGFKNVGETNPELIKIAKENLEDAQKDKDKQVKENIKAALSSYDKYLKRLANAEKRKKLRALQKKMDKADEDFAEGKISDEEYLKLRKEFLVLEQEIKKGEE